MHGELHAGCGVSHDGELHPFKHPAVTITTSNRDQCINRSVPDSV